MKLSHKHLRITFVLSVIILISAFIYSYKSIYQLIDDFNWIDHTKEVLIHLESISSDMNGAETGIRGAILTSDPQFLQSYYGAEKKVSNHYDELFQLTSDNTIQTKNLLLFKKAAELKFNILKQQLNAKDITREERIVLTKKSKRAMDEVQKIIQRMKTEEYRLLKIRKEAVVYSEFIIPLVLLFISMVGFAITGGAYWIIMKDAKARMKSEKKTKEAEKKIIENEALLIKAQEMAHMGNFEVDLKTKKLKWSDQIYKIYGLTPQDPDVDRQTAQDMMHPEDREFVLKKVQNFRQSNDPVSIEFRIIKPDKTIASLISVTKPIINEQGEIKKLIGYVQDITERKAVETQLELAKEAAQNANKFKSSFLANMSHEIRTPINAIIGFSNILAKKDLKPEEKEYLGNIISSGQLLLKLIGDVLDISKIEQGKINIESESFHLKEVISSSLMPYKYTANEKGLSFNLIFDDRLPAYVIGDASRIKQVIINLIGNGIKFTKEGGLTVKINTLELRENLQEALINFSVSDTGIGIAEEQQENIFESFTQADNSIIRKFGGSGLGLSIVKQLISLMGGEIKVISPSNDTGIGEKGSTFYFALKLKIDKRQNQNIPSNEKIDKIKPFSKPLKVLVAEDNTFNQKLAELMLKGFDVEVDIANNGEEAVRMATSNNYSLMLIDIQMPLMDGLTATKEIRASLGKSVPIIGVTANAFKQDIEDCLAAGMNDHLGKPYDEISLYAIIKKWCFNEKVLLNNSATVKKIDLNFLKKLANGDDEIMKEILAAFLNQAYYFLRQVKIDLEAQQWQDLSQTVHKVKSNLHIVGVTSIRDIINKAERNAKKQIDLPEIPALVNEICSVCSMAVSEVEAELEELG